MAKIGEKTRAQVGIKIQKLRKQAGFTQEELADRVHLSRTHIGHIEQGRKSPSIEVLEKISRTLKVKVKDLFP